MSGMTTSGSVIGLGTFDGVHRGHRVLIQQVTDLARVADLTPAIHMFVNHPLDVLTGEHPATLSTPKEKMELMYALGVRSFFSERFTREFADRGASDFLHDLITRANARHIVVGFNYKCGRKGEGNVLALAGLCEQMGVGLHVIPPVKYKNTIVSSTAIRAALSQGDVTAANQLLGYEYFLVGEIGPGRQMGRRIGFPTANLTPDGDKALPGSGVYITRVEIDGEIFGGITNIGLRPTFGEQGGVSIETHLLGFGGDIYGQNIRLRFVKKLRDERKFELVEDLIAQINQDKEIAAAFLLAENRARSEQ